MQGVGLIFIPVFIPGFLFGILYLVISYLLAKKGNSNINHSAHIWGGLFGIGFVVICAGIFGHYPVVANFLEQVKTVRLNNLFSTY
jgi:hypothetical protein